jgi:catechol 2,3-dioxygenase-like lactoylglutathione lyase family enzyme
MFTANRDLAIFTPDLDAAHGFYADVLGLPCTERTATMLAFESGPLCLYVIRSDTPQGFTPSFDVPDAVLARTRLLAAGCDALTEGDAGGHFRDPFGFAFDVMQRS